MLSLDTHRGFTLIELLVTMSIAAVLLALGAPALGTYLQNSKIAAATSSLYSVVQSARTAAIRGNAQAQLVLTDTPLSTPNLANVLAPAVAGRNWVVRVFDPILGTWQVVETKSGAEGESNAAAPAIQLLVAAVAPTPAFGGTITFNPLGAPVDALPPNNPATYTIDITNPTGDACAAAGTMRCRRITVQPGGQITACDPVALPIDSRWCPI